MMARLAVNKTKAVCSIFLVLVLLLSLASSSCAFRSGRNTGQGADSNLTNNDYSSSILSGGLERTYIVHVGAGYDKNRPTPLLIVLHGGGGDGQGMIKLTGFNDVADENNFIVVYPDGFEKHWNDGRAVQSYSAQTQNIDDVAFISALIDHLSGEYNIDAKRVYVTGMSNGAFMSNRLGCKLSNKIAAIAPVAGNMPANIAPVCAPARPVSALIINGTEDPLVPWSGGYAHIGQVKLGEVLSVEETVKFWVDNAKCSSPPLIAQLPDKDPSDGTNVTTETYKGCADSAEVILYKVEGGGHTWPGGPQYLPRLIIGSTSRDFNASEVIWQFFSQHPMQ
jgi:polyhydroxybutyrate depolymerase